MFCYRDMTFCSFWEDCTEADGCRRCLTKEVEAGAAEWWAGVNDDEPPICRFVEKPDCHSSIRWPNPVLPKAIIHNGK
jgi:hypothetical protein